jgi:dolichol kinase
VEAPLECIWKITFCALPYITKCEPENHPQLRLLAVTLASLGTSPVAGLAVLLIIAEGGAIANAIGDGVASIVVSRWNGGLDRHA